MIDTEIYNSAMTLPECASRLGLQPKQGYVPAFDRAEAKPSVKLYESHAFDYGAGTRYDLIGFVQAARGLDFLGACEWIASETGIEAPTRSPEAEARYQSQKEISNAYQQIFTDSLKCADRAIEYLSGRGIKPEILENRVGYLPIDYQPSAKQAAERAGLISRRGNFMLNGRFILPIFRAGQIVSIYGRAVDPKRKPAHIYPAVTDPPMPQALYGLDDCKTSEHIFLTESVIDCLTLQSHGYVAVGTFGTAGLSDERRQLLKRSKVRLITIVFDADANGAGQKGALRAGERLFKAGYTVEIITLPVEPGESKQDPNLFFQKHSAAAFERLQRREYLDARLDEISRDARPEEQLKALHPVLELIASREELLWKPLIEQVHKRFPTFDTKKLLKACAQAAGNEDADADKRERFRPVVYAQQLQEPPILFHNGEFYRYSARGFYEHSPKLQIDREIIESYGTDCQVHHVTGIRTMLEILSYVAPEKVDRSGILNLQNGIINLGTGQWSEGHSSRTLSTIRIDVMFDPKATAPQWKEFLTQVLPESDKRQLLQEFFGYALTSRTDYHKSLWMVGSGSNGKSVCLEILRTLVGPRNVSHLTLADLKQRFRVAEMGGKLVNLVYEVNSKELLHDSTFKSLVAGEAILVERKGKDPHVMLPTAKWIIATNRLPDARDRSYGLMRRMCILPFQVTIPDDKQDRQLSQRLVEQELSGILNWALLGYQRLQEQGQFTEPESSIEAKRAYEQRIKPEMGFFAEYLRKGTPTDSVLLKDVYSAYTDWAKDSGHKPMSRTKLRESIETHFKVEKLRDETGIRLPGLLLL